MKGGVLLAKTYEGIDPTGWWMSEKLDGIRAVWDGKRFTSRAGNTFAAPKWFTAKLPDIPLDGELWMGRGEFARTSSVVRSSEDKGWKDVSFMAFDVPLVEAGPFEDRLALLARLSSFSSFSPFVLVRQVRCESRSHLEDFVDAVVSRNGEGAMLRKPGSLYEFRRSSTLFKVKRFLDAEAIVTGYQPGKGKYRGMLGALDCKLPSGVEFQVGTGFTDLERLDPPRIGARITFRYQELSKDGVPRFPAFMRSRPRQAGAGIKGGGNEQDAVPTPASQRRWGMSKMRSRPRQAGIKGGGE